MLFPELPSGCGNKNASIGGEEKKGVKYCKVFLIYDLTFLNGTDK